MVFKSSEFLFLHSFIPKMDLFRSIFSIFYSQENPQVEEIEFQIPLAEPQVSTVPEAQVPADMGPEVHLPVELDTEMELANEQIPMGLEAVLEPEDDHFIVYVIIYLFILFILTKINLICE